MSENKPKRKRITIPTSDVVVGSLTKYTPNSCTQTGRQFHKAVIHTDVELWFEKHCDTRQIERGLESNTLQDLTVRCINHIFYYQLRYPAHVLIQYPEKRGIKYRFILQERNKDGDLLNIATEIHFVDIGIYEITLVTAMIEENFNIFDTQLVLRVDGESSQLLRQVNKKLEVLASYIG
ncbi:hypothetical protein [Flavobacterium sp. T12S277]|uniref:hypothetical protein n=1 Tax=Flavobacterium sp. T12S277 TaxID=3402752 RepID=UPI003AE73FBC